ncbi:hypothetical protein [Nocardia seriolae]|uniref:Uncharacterized protein n=1 Tax=Nocardia seriolae TaxID=37332 RepID=A0ABC9YUC9_9NOCA|nr:hypothetical protein [Nocardia seriolae]APB00715.1 hypothetical protein NS506_06684 [Nocardia seriolae]MTJ61801.1 hypothetical protein [Nocardia seriolae]MTJ73071.1 hypothetical protein [Nocardia seriolae]MTJ90163.1 hypothetical protein [Nocardia seriolae]MTK34126.1 hypothetical protein [Nocardia seriolae]
MTTLLVVLIVWTVLSIPVALILARMFRSSRAQARDWGMLSPQRGDQEELTEFDRRAHEIAYRHRTSGDDTRRVFPPR